MPVANEQTVWSGHPSVWRERPVRFVLLAAWTFFWIGVALTYKPNNEEDRKTANWACLLSIAFGAVQFTRWQLRSLGTRFTVTSHRSILRVGILSKRTSEVRHKDIRNLTVDQTITQRLLNVGGISISSAGQSDVEISIGGIAAPNHVADLIRQRQS